MEMQPKGTIVFTTVGIPYYGFDVFSLKLPEHLPISSATAETRLTDGVSVNFNAQFTDNNDSIIFVSERSGSARLYLTNPTTFKKPERLPTVGGLFHDRPAVRNDHIIFASAHEPPTQPFKSYSAVYCTHLDTNRAARLTPPSFVDYSPAVSRSGDFVAVASYGSRPWKGDFHEIDTEIVVFRRTNPEDRHVLCRGGWPTWSGDSTVFFHRIADDGWWSIFRVDLVDLQHGTTTTGSPPTIGSPSSKRITPPGVHAFTPSAANDGKRIAVATRRKGREHRHIEIFDLESERFHPVTEVINPDLHHYNPFFSPDSTRVGYHHFRGESDKSLELVIPPFRPVSSAVAGIRMLRLLHGTFPSFSPNGELMAINGDFLQKPGLTVLRSDGSKRWTLVKDPMAFYTCWSPMERGVVYTSLGSIFHPSETTVQIARVSFDEDGLNCRKEDEVAVEVKLLTKQGTGNNAFPSCSPDGKSIVFRSGRDGRKNLYVVDAVNGEWEEDGGGIRRLTEGDWIDTMPHWSPKGDLIAFSSNRHCPENTEVFGIYLMGPDGSGLRRVELVGGEWTNRERVNHVCFSPDGEWLVFAANLGAVNAEPVSLPNHFQPYGDLYVCRLDGTCLTRLTCNAYENGTPTWHSGGLEAEMGRLSAADVVGEPLKGQFEEPLWLTCDV